MIMQNRSRVLAAAAACLVIAATALAQHASLKPDATVKEVMQALTIPLSDIIFASSSEPPTTAAQWASLRRDALALAEAGRLLTVAPRARDEGEWMAKAQAHIDAAAAVAKAAGRKNAEELSSAGDALYETCPACHARYMTR